MKWARFVKKPEMRNKEIT